MRRGRRARSAAVALSGLLAGGALLGGCTTTIVGTGTPGGTPGADGYGDPYFPTDGNGGYDVGSYALDLDFDPATDALAGTATVVATATATLSAFNLDLQGFEVSSVTVDGEQAQVTRDGGELTVTPADDIGEGAEFTTVVAYDGVPEPLEGGEAGEAGFLQTGDGALAVGQPDVAAHWFPVNDHPADAASVEVSVTVPEGLEAVSNGALVGSVTEDGRTTWQWSAPDPMAPYLVTLAVGEFEIADYEQDGIGYWDAVDPALADQDADGSTVFEVAQESLALAPEAVAVLEEWFGPYPFETAGGIVDDVALGFALENQTRPVYGSVFFTAPGDGELVVVHEMAHQWAGDSVRLAGWQHIWLNEGFATYAEWLWADAQGTATPQESFDAIAETPAADPFWRPAIGDPGPDDLFDEAVYYRGAMTLHALRLEVGEESFAEIVRTWFTSQAGEAVTTDDFVALAEEVSGQQLDDFFAEWLGEGKPAGLG